MGEAALLHLLLKQLIHYHLGVLRNAGSYWRKRHDDDRKYPHKHPHLPRRFPRTISALFWAGVEGLRIAYLESSRVTAMTSHREPSLIRTTLERGAWALLPTPYEITNFVNHWRLQVFNVCLVKNRGCYVTVDRAFVCWRSVRRCARRSRS